MCHIGYLLVTNFALTLAVANAFVSRYVILIAVILFFIVYVMCLILFQICSQIKLI